MPCTFESSFNEDKHYMDNFKVSRKRFFFSENRSPASARHVPEVEVPKSLPTREILRPKG